MISLSNKILGLYLILNLTGCSLNITEKNFEEKEYLKGLVTEVKPKWFRTIKRFSLENRSGDIAENMFFDINPKVNLKAKTLNAYIHTPKGSLFLNDFDVSSGRYYYSKSLCGTYDSTKKFDRVIKSPNFSIGIIPRYLDQLNTPQKIIVFGSEDFIKKYHHKNSMDVRVVGGFVHRVCPKGGCLEVDDWLSRLVLVGVHKNSEQLKDVTNINELKKEVDWDYTIAFLKNGFGKNKVATNYYSAYQVGQFVDAFRALKFLTEKSNHFSLDKMKSVQKSCYSLYDYAYKSLSYKSIADRDTKSISNYKVKKSLIDKLKAEGKEPLKSFSQRFKQFHDKYGDEFLTCSKLVYSSNINDDVKRHWFFYYLKSAFLLQDLGFSYRCGQKIWTQNSIMSDGQPMYSRKKEFLGCSNDEIDMAMSLAPAALKDISLRGFSSYRYVDYDELSHQKLYSWTTFSNKRFKCEDKDYEFYPKDIRWKR